MNCPNCRTPNPETARFCFNCGSPLQQSRPIEGERRIVTVMFADVVGSTAMAEILDPEQVTEIMDGAFRSLNSTIASFGGTVSRLMGDSVLALFGAPITHENDPERAVRAALAIQDANARYAEAVQTQYGVDFALRVGINTGLVVLATVGDQIRTEYTVMGDTVNVASRLQSVADPGQVLVSGDTYRLVRHLIEVEERGPISLKGKSEPVETFAVIRLRARPSSGRGLEGIISPLVGRERELEALMNGLTALRDGQGGLLAILGEAGLGKSRLVAEVRKRILEPESTLAWHEGRAISLGQGVAYQPWREVLRSIIGTQPNESSETVRAKLATVLDVDGAAHDLPFLEVLLNVESQASAEMLTELDGSVLARRITEAVQHAVSTSARRSPLVLVFEDLHWADNATLNLLLAISDGLADLPALLICVTRPDESMPVAEFLEQARSRLEGRYQEIWLAPLDSAHAGELMGNLLYIEDLPAAIRETILTKSDGNPFFLEEIIRELIDSEHIVRENGHWRATAEIVNVSVPDTLAGVLGARIDRLPDQTRQVAQMASILGRIFPYQVLKAVCETAPPEERVDDLTPHLERLVYEELIRERSRDPELEYIFKHALTQEAAYNLMLVRRRKDYHRRAGAVLERLYADRLDEHAAALAYHFWHGDDWQRAADYSMRAGNRAQYKLYALREAYEHYERAYQALEQIPDAFPEQVCDVVLAWTGSALNIVPHDEVLGRLHRVEVIARELGDKARLAQILHWSAHINLVDGAVSHAMSALFENAQLAEELDDERLRVYPAWAMAFSLINSDPRRARDQMLEVRELAQRHRSREIEAHSLGSLAVASARLGEFSEVQNYIDQSFEALRDVDAPVTLADMHLLASIAYFDMGDLERGLKHGRIGADMSMEWKAWECAGAGYCIVGLSRLGMNDVEEALNTFQKSMEFSDLFMTDQMVMNQAQAGMAIARYANGDAGALVDIEGSLVSSRAIGDEYTAALVCLSLADAYAKLERYDDAERCVDETLAYYRRAGMLPHLARALEALAHLRAMQGDAGAAQQARAEAEQLRRELKIPVQS
jgi:class 3 adenylate cyclase/tetratricopeptide (TPR) repeat protein